MTEDQLPIRGARSPYADEGDDTQGHGVYRNANETVDVNDVEGHKKAAVAADAETPEGGDVEGHIYVEDRDELSGQRLR